MNVRIGDWIQVHSGRQFWPLDPRAEEIDIGDIAHALSLVCRFTGHVKEFYSVAQHSVLVALTVKRWLADAMCDGCKDGGVEPVQASWCRDVDGRLLCDVCFAATSTAAPRTSWALDDRGVRLLALAGLLHDGSEAYLCDVARPIKMLAEMARYREAEAKVQSCVYEAFNLWPIEPRIVKRADDVLLSTEARDLLATLHPAWTVRPPGWPTLEERIVPCSSKEAERMFLQTFEELKP